MSGNKTRPTLVDAEIYINQVDNPVRRHDSRILTGIMQRITGHPPVMWGPSIVGFGSHRYRHDSGREGESFEAGFAPRKSELVIYLMGRIPEQEQLLAALGSHRMGKACLYVKRLDGIDIRVLEDLIARSVAAVRASWN